MKLTYHRCQCAGCEKYFNSVGAFDKHRTGKHEDRRCMTADEMLLKGMWVDKQGWWYGSIRKSKPVDRR